MQVLPSPEYPFMQLHVNSPRLASVHVANKGWQSSLAEPQAGDTKLHNYIIHKLLNIKITKLFCNYYLGVHIFYQLNRLIYYMSIEIYSSIRLCVIIVPN